MSNMGYCRFENTNRDLRDCAEVIEDKLDGEEAKARVWLILRCAEILETIGVEIDTQEVERLARELPTGPEGDGDDD